MESPQPGERSVVIAAVQPLTNLVPLVGVVAFGWLAFDLLVLYWLEGLFVAIAGSVVFTVVVPKTPDRHGPVISLCMKLGVFVLAVLTFGTVMLMIGVFFLGYVEGQSAGAVLAAARRVDVALLALAVNQLIWVLSLYLPQGQFTKDGVTAATHRLFREFAGLLVLACIITFLIRPFFESTFVVLVLVVMFKMYLIDPSIGDPSHTPPNDSSGATSTAD